MAHVGSCSEGVGGGVQLKFCSSSPQISDLGYLRNTFGWVSWCYHNVEKKLQREKEENNRLRLKVNILEEELANDCSSTYLATSHTANSFFSMSGNG